MLSKDTLLSKLKEPRSKQWVETLALELVEKGFNITDLLELTTYPEKQLAFRSAWLLDTVVTGNVLQFVEHVDQFIAYAGKTNNHSCCRHYARIYMYFTSINADKAVKQKIAETNMETVVEQCFEWLIDPYTKVAVKACAAQVLFNLQHRYNWIAEELQNQLVYLMKNGSPAIQATGRRLLNALTIG